MDEMGNWLEDLLGEISSNENQEICQGLLKKCGGRCAERNALPGMGGLKEELAGVERMEEIARIISRHTGAECVPDEDGFLLTYNRGKGCDLSLIHIYGSAVLRPSEIRLFTPEIHANTGYRQSLHHQLQRSGRSAVNEYYALA